LFGMLVELFFNMALSKPSMSLTVITRG
jgi:hypothetical protein